MNTKERSLRTRLADELRAEMARQDNMSGRQMAAAIGRPQNTVNGWLGGTHAIDPDALEAMCNVLGMTTSDLYAAARRNGGWTIQMPPVRQRPKAMAGASTPQGRNRSTRQYTRSMRAVDALHPRLQGETADSPADYELAA
jgi:transcriptional regulator with XRE-family HTH domain